VESCHSITDFFKPKPSDNRTPSNNSSDDNIEEFDLGAQEEFFLGELGSVLAGD
jgi:hypothetical protein